MANHDHSSAHLPADYDHQVGKTIPYYDAFHDETLRLVQAAGIKPKTWLDTGCGTGSFAGKAMKMFPGTVFVLCDPSEQMMEEARKKLEPLSNGKVKFLKPAGTSCIEAPECGVPDVITAIQSHHYLSKDARIDATRKCYDLLPEDGLYITFENTAPTTMKGVEIGKEYWKQHQILNGRGPAEAEKHIARYGVEYFPITVEDHYFLYRLCGFRVVEMLWYSCMQAGFYCMK